MVEAIAFGATVVATETAATGIMKSACGTKLAVVADNDWNRFSSVVIDNINNTGQTPAEFYNHYFYGNIIKNLAVYL